MYNVFRYMSYQQSAFTEVCSVLFHESTYNKKNKDNQMTDNEQMVIKCQKTQPTMKHNYKCLF
jgi:hypothetical protein